MRESFDTDVELEADTPLTVVEFACPFDAEKAESIVKSVYSSDGGEDLRRAFAKSGEVISLLVLFEYLADGLPAYPPEHDHRCHDSEHVDVRCLAAEPGEV